MFVAAENAVFSANWNSQRTSVLSPEQSCLQKLIPPNAAKLLLHTVIRTSIVCRAFLVTPKRNDGINPRRTAGGNIAGKQRNACKQERNRTQGNRVAGANPE